MTIKQKQIALKQPQNPKTPNKSFLNQIKIKIVIHINPNYSIPPLSWSAKSAHLTQTLVLSHHGHCSRRL